MKEHNSTPNLELTASANRNSIFLNEMVKLFAYTYYVIIYNSREDVQDGVF